MSDPIQEKPKKRIAFTLIPTDDDQITCIVCRQEKCEYEFETWPTAFTGHCWHGIHAKCAEKYLLR